MLLFVAFATAHAVSVSTENKTPSSITLNGVSIGAGAKEDIEVNGVAALEVVDVAGEKHYGTYAVPADVTALGLVYEDGFVKLKVDDTDPIEGLLETLIGLLLGLLKCLLGGDDGHGH